ncbi:hypothetical protein ACQP10_01970 [Streptosporangium sandarakinum]|uniref:hypothetical protein n=1 Tax=Streptosporangium sandarakinum TaxID=1260955 RepID=UPI003D89F930
MRPDMTLLAHGGGAGPWKWDVFAVVCWLLLLAAAYLGGLRAFSGPRLRSVRAGARRLGTVRAACFAGGCSRWRSRSCRRWTTRPTSGSSRTWRSTWSSSWWPRPSWRPGRPAWWSR